MAESIKHELEEDGKKLQILEALSLQKDEELATARKESARLSLENAELRRQVEALRSLSVLRGNVTHSEKCVAGLSEVVDRLLRRCLRASHFGLAGF